MIVHFRHKGLKLLYESGDRRRVRPDQAEKLERILARLDVAAGAEDMHLPGFRLHPLKGNRAGGSGRFVFPGIGAWYSVSMECMSPMWTWSTITEGGS